MSEETTEGVSRRNVLKKGAIAGGALVWATPVVQSFGGAAFGQDRPPESPRCTATIVADAIDISSSGGGGITPTNRPVTFTLQILTDCGDCEATSLTVVWKVNSSSNFTPVGQDPTDPLAFRGTIPACSAEAFVDIQATVTLTCEDAVASDCRREQFTFATGCQAPGAGVVVACA